MAGVEGRDTDAHFAYLAEGNARQARKRIAADVLVTDEHGRVLLVDPTYKDGWDLPGGMVEANESPQDAARRELHEELGLTIAVDRPLAVEWVNAHGPWDDHIVFVFDGGILDPDQAATIHLADQELARWEFVEIAAAQPRLRPDIWQLLRNAITARATDTTTYTERK